MITPPRGSITSSTGTRDRVWLASGDAVPCGSWRSVNSGSKREMATRPTPSGNCARAPMRTLSGCQSTVIANRFGMATRPSTIGSTRVVSSVSMRGEFMLSTSIPTRSTCHSRGATCRHTDIDMSRRGECRSGGFARCSSRLTARLARSLLMTLRHASRECAERVAGRFQQPSRTLVDCGHAVAETTATRHPRRSTSHGAACHAKLHHGDPT